MRPGEHEAAPKVVTLAQLPQQAQREEPVLVAEVRPQAEQVRLGRRGPLRAPPGGRAPRGAVIEAGGYDPDAGLLHERVREQLAAGVIARRR